MASDVSFGGPAIIGLLCVLTASVSSGYSGVYFEKILKTGPKNVSYSLPVRNLQMGEINLLGNAFLI
jgi:hypothetical protein